MLTSGRPNTGLVGTSRVRALLIAALVAACALIGLSASAGSAFAATTPATNPDLASKCGINVMVVLDESGSINSTAGATTGVRNAAWAFISSLKGTGSQVAITEFNSRARKIYGYTAVTDANGGTDTTNANNIFRRYIFDTPDGAGATPGDGYDPSEYGQADQWTNWDDALQEVQQANNGDGTWAGSPKADLVVFITDGDPTAFNNSTHPPLTEAANVSVLTNQSNDGNALDFAIQHANAVKAQGSHMFAVGVGAALGNANSEARLQKISGPDKYPTPTADFAQGDYTLVQDFANLEAALKDIATSLCKSSVTITKQVDEGDGQGYKPASGWTFGGSVTVSSPTFTWVQPGPPDATNPRSANTDANGTATFQWKPSSSGATSSIQITETQKTGYELTAVDCKKNGVDFAVPDTLTFDISGLLTTDVVTCTVKNQRQKGSIELKKAWSGTAGQTTLNIGTAANGSQTDTQLTGANGAAPLTTGANTVNTGTYFVSESGGLADYDQALACTRNGNAFTPGANGQVDVNKSDVVVCTFTNTRKTGSIELKKAWSGTAGQTTLNIGTAANGSQTDTQLTGANGAAPLTTGANTVNTGTYFVSESGGLADYDQALACTRNGNAFTPGANGQVDVNKSDVVVCTFTNTRKTGTIKLVKKLNGGGSDKFNLKLNNVDQTVSPGGGTAFGDADATAVLTKDTGSYSVTEAALAPATDAQYSESLSCINNGTGAADTDGSVTIAAGDNWVCTFTNTRKTGTIKLVKKLNGGGSDKFNLKLNNVDQTVSPGGGTAFGDADATAVLTKDTGSYSVTEAALAPATDAQYSESLSCINNGTGAADTDGSVTIAAGDNWVCTFTNTKGAKVTVKKVADPADGTDFGFSGSFGDFKLDDEAGQPNDAVNNSETFTVKGNELGTKTITEAGTTGWTLTDIACSKGDGQGSTATINVAAGDDITCTFKNTKKGTIKLVKHFTGPFGDDTVTLNIDQTTKPNAGDNAELGPITVEGNSSPTIGEEFTAGIDPANYATSFECVNGIGLSADGLQRTVTVPAGKDVVCTITNRRKSGTIEIVKNLLPASDSGRFDLLLDGAVKKADVGDQGTTGAITVPTGDYTVAEQAANVDTKLSDYVTATVCLPANQEVLLSKLRLLANNPDAQTAGTTTTTVSDGENVVCTITNKRVALEVVKTHAETGTDSRVVYNGDTLNFVYKVTNKGGADLFPIDGSVVDDKCSPVTGPTAKSGGNEDDVLEPGETWTYTCTKPAPTTDKGGPDEVNTVTAKFVDSQETPVTATDTATTVFRHPKIAIDKVGPATATVGDILSYQLNVTNPGDTSFDADKVVVTDEQCDAGTLSGPAKNGDATPNQLNPGDTWTYTCSKTTTATTSNPFVNVATVKGTDTGGKVVTASDSVSTVVNPAGGGTGPSGASSGKATLTGTVGCVASKWSKASVSGSKIAKVTFKVNGKKVKTLTKPNVGRKYQLRVRTKSLKYGTYKVTATVQFTTEANTKPKTLRLQFSRCKPRVVKPKFTG